MEKKRAKKVAVIGGSGLYKLEQIEVVNEHQVTTPFGSPSSLITEACIGDTTVLFLARHGSAHQFLPGEINYRANLYALKALGAEWCIAVSAVGSLCEEMKPGDFVVPDQIIDHTRQRPSSFFGDGVAAHISFADPYCDVLRGALVQTCRSLRFQVHEKGCAVTIEGPAFSTRAESNVYRLFGANIIGMTGMPEARLAREAELSYSMLAIVTDYDCWRHSEDVVDATKVLEVLKQGAVRAGEVVRQVVPMLMSLNPSRRCAEALNNAIISDMDKIPSASLQKLSVILDRYRNAHRHQ